MSPLFTQRWGHIALPLSLSLSQSVHLFLSSAFYCAGGQTQDVDPMLG